MLAVDLPAVCVIPAETDSDMEVPASAGITPPPTPSFCVELTPTVPDKASEVFLPVVCAVPVLCVTELPVLVDFPVVSDCDVPVVSVLDPPVDSVCVVPVESVVVAPVESVTPCVLEMELFLPFS